VSHELPEGARYVHRIPPTPLVAVRMTHDDPAVWCKLEFLNPSGSTKDRIARFILEKAWRSDRLHVGDTVVEASSGSTSIALALVSAQLGLRFVAVMPEGVSGERVLTIEAYGGEVVLTRRSEGILGSLAEAERLASETGAFLPRQFENPDNAEAHRVGTAREITDQIPGGAVDAVVAGVGTGGTLVGLQRGLMDCGSLAVPVLARPVNVVRELEVECCSFSTRIPGVVDSLSRIFDPSSMPGLETIEVEDDDALAATRRLHRLGFPAGPSSGLNLEAATRYSRARPGASVVTVLPDRMERYFTTELFPSAAR
jgi:cysteine synthase